MDYNKVKLGLIEKFKVWNKKRIAEIQRDKYYKVEGELLSVDYSEANKLQLDLLKQKKIKKATKDASRLYKKFYGKNNDEMGESDFIEDYLAQNGLIQKKVSEPDTPKKDSFMEKSPVEESTEKIVNEKTNKQPKIYYRINDKNYELPSSFYQYAINMANMDKFLPLEEQEDGNYILVDNKMNPNDKYNMLSSMVDIISTNVMGWINEYLLDLKNEQLENRKNNLCRKINQHEYIAKKLYAEGNAAKANEILTGCIEYILNFEQVILQAEQETLQSEQEEVRKSSYF